MKKTRKLRRRYTGAAGKLDAWRDSAFGGVINFRLFFEWFREDRNMKTVYEWKHRTQKIHSYMQ